MKHFNFIEGTVPMLTLHNQLCICIFNFNLEAIAAAFALQLVVELSMN
jgi:hypothetical protein